MTYSQQTIDTVQRALDAAPCTSCGAAMKHAPRWNCAHPGRHTAIPRHPEAYTIPNFGDTCCGKCPGATCYVDMMTGERG